MLGGVDERDGPKNEGWWLDLSGTPTWRHFTMPDGETVGAVVAMLYRHQDQAVYFLDFTDGALRLRRWNALRRITTGKLQTLAIFPTGWGAFSRYAVVAGDRGEMGIVGYGGTGSEKTRFGRVAVNPASQVSLVALTKSTTIELASAPALAPAGFVYTTRAFEGGFLSLPTQAPPQADSPTILPH